MKAMIERAFSIAKLEIAYTQGFSPHPRISYGPALPVGTESEEEFLTVELKKSVDVKNMIDALNNILPEGMRFYSGEKIDKGDKKTGSNTNQRYEVKFLDASLSYAITAGVENFAKSGKILINRTRKNKQTEIDIKEQVVDMVFDEATQVIKFSIIPPGEATVRPAEVITSIIGPATQPDFTILKKKWVPQLS
jgi:radical SAM-linked protein